MGLTKKRVLLGVTGGIAAYKAAEFVRLLVQDQFEVQVVMTEAARQFITPGTLQALSGKPVFSDLWDQSIANNMAHIDLSRNSDLILIAPASADFIAKLAHGLADDLLSTLCLARDCPLLVAPAMNQQMWERPATQRNIERLRADEVVILGPASGSQACGEVGPGRMLEAEQLLDAVKNFFQPKLLQGRRILITAGPTYEAIDAVRGITNLSSGKMGYAVAQAAVEAGASVKLVSGPTSLTIPHGVERVNVVSADQMLDAVMQEINYADIFISVAAVADYKVNKVSDKKIKKTDEPLKLELIPTTDILAHVAALPNAPFCVGFAAETENLNEYAETKRRGKKLPLLVGNLAQNSLGTDETELVLFDDSGTHVLKRADKNSLARQLVAHIIKLFREKNSPKSKPVLIKK